MPAHRWAHLLATLGVVAGPTALAAQGAAPGAVPRHEAAPLESDDARQASAPGVGLEVHGLALGGITAVRAGMSSLDSMHYAGGAIVQVEVRRFGVMGLGMLGRGGEYESTLVGAALSVRVLTAGPLELTGFGGYGWYSEEGWTGIRRDSGGPLFGGLAMLRAGRVAIGVALTDLTGRYDGADVREPFRFHVPRLSLGLGF